MRQAPTARLKPSDVGVRDSVCPMNDLRTMSQDMNGGGILRANQMRDEVRMVKIGRLHEGILFPMLGRSH